MNELEMVYPKAVEQTKHKIYEDLDRFLEDKENMPSLEQFLEERKDFIQQIWINVWLNKVTNDVPRSEKKSYLREKGFEVEGVDRRLINKLFRTEIKGYQPFDVLLWIDQEIAGKEKQWEERYNKARSRFLTWEEEREREERKRSVHKEIEEEVLFLLEQNFGLMYLYVRDFSANQLAHDLKNGTKYTEVDTFHIEEKLIEEGNFNPSDYVTVDQFFRELTGAIHKTFYLGRSNYEYETYYNVYERLISDYLFDFAPKIMMETLPETMQHLYFEVHNEGLTGSKLKGMMANLLADYVRDYLLTLEEEYLIDLLKLEKIPFELKVHQELFEQAVAERERRKAEELAELERKRAEEARMLEDIFGREYRPSLERDIHYVLHIGETNTGKTHHALERMKKANSGLYLAPLRLLALEVYDKLNNDDIACSLKTGEEEKIVPGANHISCTVEMFHEKDFYDVVVIDEAQMIADKDRGFSWFKAITKANANEVHIIGSRNMKPMILQLLGDSHIEIHEYSRDIPLKVERREFSLKFTKKGDALVCFSRRRVLETASRLQGNGKSVSMIYGSMPPETRKKQMQRFINGETTVIVSTDAIGMGLNLPIRRIVFLENEKFDGTRRRRLTSQEIKQIAGRAGRKGLYDIGKVAFSKDIKMMERLLEKEDEPVHTFAIAPTNSIFERFQKYSNNLGDFFDLWLKFESPKGTKKATLIEERELYELIRDTEIEGRLSMMDLYGFLHLPFSTKEPSLIRQWKNTMYAIVEGNELPEPVIKRGTLEELELSYKAVGLHLLFLYRLEQRTETIYWERVREELSDGVHEVLKGGVRAAVQKCRLCGKKLPMDHGFQICDACHEERYQRKYNVYYNSHREY